MKNIKDYLKVDPTSPSGLRWKQTTSIRMKPGDAVGNLSHGYWRFSFNYKNYGAHQLVLLLSGVERPSPKHEPDHINGDKTDNRIENLRWVTRSRNNLNTSKDNGTGFRWVTYTASRSMPYSYQMQYKGKRFNASYFATAEEAHAAALAKRKELELPIETRLSTVH